MPELLGYLLLFTGVGAAFVFVNLMVGKLIRPAKMNAEKATIYECGEPTVGSAWVQFDLRFYVVALLFVIFDVEMAFFFPWAVVFGQSNTLAEPNLPIERRVEINSGFWAGLPAAERARLADVYRKWDDPEETEKLKAKWEKKLGDLRDQLAKDDANIAARDQEARQRAEGEKQRHQTNLEQAQASGPEPTAGSVAIKADIATAGTLRWLAFFDILFFFGVLLVGFAYLWRRGDLNWVRSTAAQTGGVASAPHVSINGEARPREQLVVLTRD